MLIQYYNQTYSVRSYSAHTTDGRICYVPDQAAENQKDYDGKKIPIVMNGMIYIAKLRGDLYGLHTPGTGDMIVEILS